MSESLEVVCPDCQSSIPLEDVNVANDIALCRKCSKNFSFSETIGSEGDPPVDLAHPPKGIWYQRTPNGFELGTSTRSPIAFFLVPFMALWSGGSIGGIYGTQIAKRDFDLFQSLFGLPFLFGTVVIGLFVVMTVCGKFLIRAEGGQGELFAGVGSVGYRKKFRWDAVRDIRLETKRTAKGGHYQQILIDADKPVTVFFTGDARRNFFLAALRQLHRDFFQGARAVPPRISEVA